MSGAGVDVRGSYLVSAGSILDYEASIRWQDWMEGSQLILTGLNAGGGGATEVDIGVVAEGLLAGQGSSTLAPTPAADAPADRTEWFEPSSEVAGNGPASGTAGDDLATIALASCRQEVRENQQTANQLLSLSIKLAGVETPGTRIIETPAQTGQLVLSNGHIFVVDPSGTVIANAAMNVPQATTTGQVINSPVATNSRVYVLGNVPSSVDVSTLTTWQRIQQTAVTISTSQQNNYRNAAMANTSGQPAAITVTGNSGAVTVEINPLYSRMELTSIQGGPTITSYNVTGVFVDSYFSSFTLSGESSGQIHYQAQSTNFAGSMGDTGTWAATGTPGNMVAVPGAGQIRVYHMAAADLPRFIVRLENIVTSSGTTITGARYVTVTGYSGQAPTRFERGRIYQMTLPFTEQQLALTPNPSFVPVTVQVRVIDWIPTVLTPVV